MRYGTFLPSHHPEVAGEEFFRIKKQKGGEMRKTGARGLVSKSKFIQGALVWLRRLTIPSLLFVIWYVESELLKFYPNFLVPTPAQVLEVINEWVFGGRQFYAGRFFTDLSGSLIREIIAFSVGGIVAIPTGILSAHYKPVEQFIDTFVQILRPIPRTAFLPFAMILFGLGYPPAIFLISYATFFVIYINVFDGVKSVDEELKRAALMLGANPRQLLFKVILPATEPFVFSGLRVGVGIAWGMVILAEMFATGNGFGYLLWRGYTFLRMDVVVSNMVFLGLLGFLFDRIIVKIAQRRLRWVGELPE